MVPRGLYPSGIQRRKDVIILYDGGMLFVFKEGVIYSNGEIVTFDTLRVDEQSDMILEKGEDDVDTNAGTVS
jgi:hypothetical protein